MENHHYKPIAVLATQDIIVSQYKKIIEHESPEKYIKTWLNICFRGSSAKLPSYAVTDFQLILMFLYNYRNNAETLSTYRCELERLLQWSWFVHEQSLLSHKSADIEAFAKFCVQPYRRWIGLKKSYRFKRTGDQLLPNPNWYPFEASVSKYDRKLGKMATKDDYKMSPAGLRSLFSALGSFYASLAKNKVILTNPVVTIRQKSKFLPKSETSPKVRHLSDKQWQMVMTVANKNANKDTDAERDVFILSCLYGMYIRVSDLTWSDYWQPTMGDFVQDKSSHWWLRIINKKSKLRHVAVSNSMLEALKRYRSRYLKLSPTPLPNEMTPLIGHVKNFKLPVTSNFTIQKLVQSYFDRAAYQFELQDDRFNADALKTATVDSLRHIDTSKESMRRLRLNMCTMMLDIALAL